MDREEAVSARPSAASPAVPSDDPPRGVSATSQQTENREDPGAGEDSPLLPYGAFQASTSPTPQLVGHRDEGPERP